MVCNEQVYENSERQVKVAKDARGDFYLMQWPANGLVYAPWFENAEEVQLFLDREQFKLVA